MGQALNYLKFIQQWSEVLEILKLFDQVFLIIERAFLIASF